MTADERRDRPVIDGVDVPLIGSGQWGRVPPDWIEYRHRATEPVVRDTMPTHLRI